MRMLQRALEGMDDAQDPMNQTVVMKGPLAEVMTKALNVAYAKPDPVTGEAAMESQAQEVTLIQQMISQANGGETPDQGLKIWGVSKDDFNQEVLTEITADMAAEVNEEKPSDYVVIVDGTRPGENSESAGVPEETVVKLESAMESITTALGGKFYRSLEEFVESVDPELVKVMKDASNPETEETHVEVKEPVASPTPEQTDPPNPSAE